jgi:hypothetical protein
MFSALRRRLHVSPTAMIATLALVFAMTGGAYAAKKYLITSTRQISPAVLKSLKGKAGPAGAQGLAGPAGPQGAAGTAGAKGETGAAGLRGADGKEGPTGKEGPAGKTGKEGSPWMAGGTLPSGKTETGAWTVGKSTAEQAGELILVPISFPIPLSAGLTSDPEPAKSRVHFVNKSGEELNFTTEKLEPSTDCSGTAEAPTAPAGNLCIYLGFAEGPVSPVGSASVFIFQAGGGQVGASTAGAAMGFLVEGAGASAYGTWAVTAP